MVAIDAFLAVLKDFGFPVACVVALFIHLQKEQDAHKAETAALTAALNELRVVLGQILTRIGGDGN